MQRIPREEGPVNRHGGLRRTPLKRTGFKRKVPLESKARAPISRTAAMKARSTRMAERYTKERIPLVRKVLAERPWCEACPVYAEHDGTARRRQRSTDVHEIVSRARGGSITDEANVLAVCRVPCHDRITTNPTEAEHLGLARHSWERDRDPCTEQADEA